jgi:peptide/nickel transport system ATP-binding protein
MTASSNVVPLRHVAPDAEPAEALLRIRGLSASFRRPNLPPVRVLNEVNLDIRAGETLGVIGESASGKSTLALNILRLLDARDLVIDSGEILWKGLDLLKVDPASMQRLRGAEISMVFQDPMTALDPLVPVHRQIAEVIQAHRDVPAVAAEHEALQLLERVGLSRAAALRRPFELSGGQRQRALISMAVANKPQLIIADEPTTALDATVQAEVLDLLKELSREVGAAVLLITHDLGVIARMCDRVMVMYSGQIVESANVDVLFGNPRMPYTWSLLQSAPKTFEGPRVIARPIPGTPPTLDKPPTGCRFHPRCEHAREVCSESMPTLRDIAPAHEARCHFADRPDWRWSGLGEAHVEPVTTSEDVVFELRGVRKIFGSGAKTVVAVDGVDMTLKRGEVLAIVGESGCGKTTLGKMIVRLIEPSAGSMLLCGEAIDPRNAAQLRAYRRR